MKGKPKVSIDELRNKLREGGWKEPVPPVKAMDAVWFYLAAQGIEVTE